jgi:hypothetical protein
MFDPNPSMRGLGMWPAMQYQSQVADRKIPAIEQTWGPYLDALSQHSQGNVRLSPKPGGSIQGTATGQPNVQQPTSVTPVAGLQQAFQPRNIKGMQDIEAENYYNQKYPGAR